MYFNEFARDLGPHDLTGTEEFASLIQSARDLNLPVPNPLRYVSRNIVLNGLRFHFLEWGDPAAPPALLLHGGHQSSHSWDFVALALSERYHVLALDQRGHGDSEWPRDGEASRQAMAEDAFAFIEGLGLKKPLVFGHSMGGLVTMTVLSQRPGLAKKAVLVDVGPEIQVQGAQAIGDFVRNSRQFPSIDEYVQRVSAYDPFRSADHVRRTMRYNIMQREDGMLESKHAPHRILAATDGQQITIDTPSLESVSSIDCPVLIVRGEQSNVLTPEAADRFASALPRGRWVVVSACGHNVHSQNTAGFLEAVNGFLDE